MTAATATSAAGQAKQAFAAGPGQSPAPAAGSVPAPLPGPSPAAAVSTADPRAVSYGFGVPLRPRLRVAGPTTVGLVRELHRNVASGGDLPPQTSDPTVPGWLALSAVGPADVGQASGVSNTMQRFGGAFGVALVSAVFAGSGHLGTAASFTAGYRPAMLGAAGLSLLGALAAAAIGRRRSSVDAVPVATETAGPHATTAVGEADTLAGADA